MSLKRYFRVNPRSVSFGYNLNYMSLKLSDVTTTYFPGFGYNLNYMSLKLQYDK